jgi:hypothetical protein
MVALITKLPEETGRSAPVINYEMVELLAQKYFNELDWSYLEKKAARPENDSLSEIQELKNRVTP